MLDLKEHPHRRYNPLTREWVLVSPQRTNRPWQGQVERIHEATRPSYDPGCYLCPGNSRAGGHRNPAYNTTFVFDNDFATLLPDVPVGSLENGLFVARSERGICRVVCFSPDHSMTLARMSPESIRPVVDIWTAQYQELLSYDYIRNVQIFENRGESMGCSNPHPHCQIWANETMPNGILAEQSSLAEYAAKNGACLLCDYVAAERRADERVVFENRSFIVLVPFWAVWPFETLLLAKRHAGGLDDLTDSERNDLSSAIHRIGVRYDNLFSTSFPNTMGFHQHPADTTFRDVWHLHAHYYPPLLRSATVRKFMVGYEMLAMPQRDITPETAAARLRESSEIHYLEQRE